MANVYPGAAEHTSMLTLGLVMLEHLSIIYMPESSA